VASATVLLCLTQAEAETIAAMLQFVGGSPKTSRRRHAESVVTALNNIGVRLDVSDVDRTKVGSIHFKNRP
jgi:hypothetical protein